MERKEGKEVEGEVRPGEGVFAQLIWRTDSIQSQCKDVRLEAITRIYDLSAQYTTLQLSEKNFPAQTLVSESSRTNTSPPCDWREFCTVVYNHHSANVKLNPELLLRTTYSMWEIRKIWLRED